MSERPNPILRPIDVLLTVTSNNKVKWWIKSHSHINTYVCNILSVGHSMEMSRKG